jgi:hypothetical protein
MMKYAALAVLGLFTVAACEKRAGEDSARGVDAADTVVTSAETMDTTIVTRDTTVDVDTTKKEGDKTVRRDTLKKTGPSATQPADTAAMDTAR